MLIKKFTPILLVDSIEDNLTFWVDKLHYKVSVSVPHGKHLGFVILHHGESEVMLQTNSSLSKDIPAIMTPKSDKQMVLYADVESLDEIEASLVNVDVIVPKRKTFYGATEIWIREPSGNVVGFAEFPKDAAN